MVTRILALIFVNNYHSIHFFLFLEYKCLPRGGGEAAAIQECVTFLLLSNCLWYPTLASLVNCRLNS